MSIFNTDLFLSFGNRIITGTPRAMVSIYRGAVTLAGVYGLYRGICIWIDWYTVRKPYRLQDKTAQPIVNATVDAGKLALDITTTTISSMTTVAFFPITIPLFIHLNQEPEDTFGETAEQLT